jgi:hypothetical protein
MHRSTGTWGLGEVDGLTARCSCHRLAEASGLKEFDEPVESGNVQLLPGEINADPRSRGGQGPAPVVIVQTLSQRHSGDRRGGLGKGSDKGIESGVVHEGLLIVTSAEHCPCHQLP